MTKKPIWMRGECRVFKKKTFVWAESPRRMSMMKMFAILMVLVSSTACMEGLPSEETPPDAAIPPTQPDACPTPVVADANVVNSADADVVPVPDAMTPVPDAAVPLPVDAAVPSPDATPVAPDATPASPDATPEGPCGVCAVDSDCNDSRDWTSDSCSSGTCHYELTGCGGMEEEIPAVAASCSFWGGFGTGEPAPPLGSFVPAWLATGPSGGSWKGAPDGACSVICYDAVGNRVAINIRTQYVGATGEFLQTQYNGVMKGTFDGLHLEW